MATNKKLKDDLLNHLKVTPQRLSQKIKKVKKDHGPMSTTDATYVIAHDEEFDLTKYLEEHVIDRIRSLLPKTKDLKSFSASSKKNKQKSSKKIIIELKLDSKLIKKFDVLLSTTQVEDTQKMAMLYPKYYIFENSIRMLIKSFLSKKHGKNWWRKSIPKSVRENVKNRKEKESKKPWHGKRGQHEIFYSDFCDLKNMIIANWNEFKHIFPDQAWITQKLKELEHPRNVLAHHNPVSATDQKRIELYLHDWITLVESKSSIINKN